MHHHSAYCISKKNSSLDRTRLIYAVEKHLEDLDQSDLSQMNEWSLEGYSVQPETNEELQGKHINFVHERG